MHLFIITIYVHRLESGLNCHLQICQFQEGTRLSLGGVNAPPCPPPPLKETLDMPVETGEVELCVMMICFRNVLKLSRLQSFHRISDRSGEWMACLQRL